MTPDAYRAALSRLGLSQAAFGRLLGLAKDQPNRYAMGRAPIPVPVAVVLSAMDEGRLSADDVRRMGA
jgi:hypothetical protein